MADQKRVVYEYLEALLADPSASSDELPSEFDAEFEQMDEVVPLTESEIAPDCSDEDSLNIEESLADQKPVVEAIETIEVVDMVEPQVEVVVEEPELVHDEQSIADEWPQEPVVPVTESQALASESVDIYAQEYESMMKCVLVRVHGLNLAIPVDYIDGAVHITTVSMSIEMHHDWILGRFGPQHDRTTVVDTARWVIPDAYSVEKTSYSDIIILSGRDWALACDELVKSINIPRKSINFNSNKEARAWLLGTYMPERCAILDIDQLVGEFELMII
ncbi:chemotaxis protein CheW [Nitrincola sp. MINF-07-Sa-05]|uniref:chemotaxis protein CheW n=1 Tax=Nitrincola salilacus TaxID=3400273 RepID=UPI003917EC04